MALAISSTSLSSFPNREICQKVLYQGTTTSSWLSRRRTLTIRNAKKGVSDLCVPLPPDRPLWFPGSSPPEWLDGSLPGDFGFDPLGLGSDPELLKWFAQAELVHGRWAMLGVSGILIPEILEGMGYVKNFSWYNAGGLWFDPMQWGRGSPEPVMVLRTKEIKNGRLAMLAFVGFCFQAVYVGDSPIQNLMAHLADPGHCNIFSAFTSR
ncbi:unnamed protein product [Vicia faba]|uniref:Chlorophyll a-b binding protein, chloroplastic n=1 Tax=Vicia faba TaxID=3906 RepID=A0AAV0YUB2_VICFA|nr:unnamed protein product [Vicia faba]